MCKLPTKAKNVLSIFVLHELLISGAALIRYPHPSFWLISHTEKFSSHALLWFQYDALFYIHIGHHGYGPKISAFYPLVPILVAIVHNRWIALSIMQAVFGIDLWLLSQWSRSLKLTDKQNRVALLLFALNPAAIFYSTLYPESLIVGLWLVSFLATQRQSYYWAAIASALATLAHPTGALIGVIPLWLFIKSLLTKQWNAAKNNLIWGSGIGIGLSSFMVYSLIRWHTMLGPWIGEKTWHSQWIWPWQQFILISKHNILAMIFWILLSTPFILGLILLIHQSPEPIMRLPLILFTATILVVSLSFYADNQPFHSTLRLMSVDFPIYAGLSTIHNPYILKAIIIIWAGVSIYGAILFTHQWWWQ
ncbi:hypothetical protein [Sulfobacillus thermosulfidooxidans]|uniref:hypothetical protein n=1 Tax=Sulfobacillus thermosulfidooxidans TaxID=28034 RepID=UPI00096B96DD|nr:hypothetical protein [Sulfobacillus thermosulfidooxidans]OLZ08396.1 hypothetical protein BFX05_03980 [Sulfobacillus thermosulfidooxidans]OLZ13883.1 hypothetical protein BFX06_06100 [Sulfobacillus thermosulfidooxidans]OLZ20501.1 hypothetical protein BFX07_14895 [Sulfobacillus thermosulfidooxidans]